MGMNAFAEGSDTKASALDSHAEGGNTTAKGICSHSEGFYTTAIGNYSHVEGQSSITYGTSSHAEGGWTTTYGDYSHVEGYYTIARGDYSHVEGKYNIQDTSSTYAHIVGNGTSDAESNAHTLDWNGNAWYAGKVTAGANATNAMDLVTLQQLQAALPSPLSSYHTTKNFSTSSSISTVNVAHNLNTKHIIVSVQVLDNETSNTFTASQSAFVPIIEE